MSCATCPAMAPRPPPSAATAVKMAIGRSCCGAAHCDPLSHSVAASPPASCTSAATMSHAPVVRPPATAAACRAVQAETSPPPTGADHRDCPPSLLSVAKLSLPLGTPRTDGAALDEVRPPRLLTCPLPRRGVVLSSASSLPPCRVGGAGLRN